MLIRFVRLGCFKWLQWPLPAIMQKKGEKCKRREFVANIHSIYFNTYVESEKEENF